MATVESPAEGRVLLRNVSWGTYERLVEERGEGRVPRFHYDRGVMEIMSPSKRHETMSRVAALVVEILVVELDLDVETVGSTTFKREDLDRGFEPDESFYFNENIELVRGREKIDLDAGDPPPDLVVEVDVTNPSLDKLGIYARLGVSEVWRFAGGNAEIFVLRDETYEAADASLVFPLLSRETLFRFVERGLEMRRPAWAREVRGWVSGEGRG
ncbi:MAG: Uma2 family endonuclease [Actinomycetota bacterium]|nr:Uma2 family endonuclease [Rubrobacter sp.]MDQ3507925.1 Uma2 family endonuclease [Actinomycetota bacterium]